MAKIRVKERKTVCKRKRDNYQTKLTKKKLINNLRNELGSCTTHGVPYVVNTELHWFQRLFWVISFICCVALMCALLSAQYLRFVKAPVVMSVEMDYFNWNVSYPAITLCPLIKSDETLSILINESKIQTGKNFESLLWGIASASITDIEKLDIPSADMLEYINPSEYADMAKMVFKNVDKNSITTNNNWPITIEAVMTEMGMCHVINSNVAVFDNPDKWRDNVMVYSKNNIELSVYDRDFFTQIINNGDIYKVYIHNPNEIVLATSSSFTYNVEGYLYFGVDVWITRISEELRNTPISFRNCRLLSEPISKRYPVYSFNHCLLECRINMILKLCQCIPHFYKPIDGERVCNIAELACLAKYKTELLTLTPTQRTLKKLHNKGLTKSPRDCGCLSSCENDVYMKDKETFVPQSSMNRLRIGISTFPKTRVVKELIFSVHDILLKIGGLVNLCIGSSIISVMEFLLMAIKIPIYKILRALGYAI